jgi:hypothetical protein
MKPLDPNPAAIVCEIDSLSQLAAQINGAYASGVESTLKGLTYYKQVGVMLTRAKVKCGHGHWLSWVAKNLKFSDRQARKYMRLAREWDPVKSELNSDLEGALRMISEDPPDEPERCHKKLKINPTFQTLWPPRTDDELQRLEKQLLAEGIWNPIVYWQETGDILDGMLRFAIAQKHGLPYRTTRLSFATEEEAIEWIVDNQLARLNLTDEQRAYYIGKKYLAEKQPHGGQQPGEGMAQNEPSGSTAEKVAAETGVSQAKETDK